MQIVQLKKIVTLAAGANHILALDNKGHVFAWGSGQQNQLGRRVVERTRSGGLVPREFGLPRGKVVSVSCGSYHSFAMDTTGRVWAWGLNNFAETGIAEGAGDDNAIIPNPAIVKSLSKYKIKQIDGGGHHSLAATEDGQLLSWGRVDGHQIGITTDKLPEDAIIRDDRGIPRILNRPVVVPGKLLSFQSPQHKH
jgi:regulator of chromosome condensation